ncbi:MAG: hypothetical protein K6G65_01390, partial [Lachnospiraceae bacterium]|nr:hypothetical protein [Lachnospiraceae bacterium]
EKPVIYVYPKEDKTAVTISIKHKEPLDIEYPLSDNGNWSLVADKDGTLHYKGREYNYIYWEDTSNWDKSFEKGFCVKKEDTVAFLEEALTKLGLNEKEQDDFITYWLPKLYAYDWNLISFNPVAYEKEYTLEVSKKANVINAFMIMKGVKEKTDIAPQKLENLNDVSRDGLTVVTWGGTCVDSD